MDGDLDYGPVQLSLSHSRSFPSMRDLFNSDENRAFSSPRTFNSNLILSPLMHIILNSNDDILADEISSESSDDNSNTDSWVEDLTDIKDFVFDDSFLALH